MVGGKTLSDWIEQTLEMLTVAASNIDKLITAQIVKISKLQSKLLTQTSPTYSERQATQSEVPDLSSLATPYGLKTNQDIDSPSQGGLTLRERLQMILDLGSDIM